MKMSQFPPDKVSYPDKVGLVQVPIQMWPREPRGSLLAVMVRWQRSTDLSDTKLLVFGAKSKTWCKYHTINQINQSENQLTPGSHSEGQKVPKKTHKQKKSNETQSNVRTSGCKQSCLAPCDVVFFHSKNRGI